MTKIWKITKWKNDQKLQKSRKQKNKKRKTFLKKWKNQHRFFKGLQDFKVRLKQFWCLLWSHVVLWVQCNGRYTVTFVTAVCYAEVLFQPSFLLNTLHAETETITRWLWCGLVDAAYHGTWPCTDWAYSLDLLTTHLSIAVCISMRVTQSVWHIIHVMNLSQSVVSASVARTSHRSPWALTLRMVAEFLGIVSGYSLEIHGSTLWRQLRTCLREWSISRIKPCRQDNDRPSAEQALAAGSQRVSRSHPQEPMYPPGHLESSTRAL